MWEENAQEGEADSILLYRYVCMTRPQKENRGIQTRHTLVVNGNMIDQQPKPLQQSHPFLTTTTSTISPPSILQQSLAFGTTHPLQALTVTLILICTATRIITGIRYRSTISKATGTSSPQTVATLPYWIPWLGHAIPFVLGGTAFLSRTTRRLGANGSLYALTMGNTKHNIVTVPSLAHQILNDRHAPVSMEPFVFRAMHYVWDDRGSIAAIDPAHLWGDIHGVLSGMLRESFVATAIKRTVRAVEERTFHLVSGAQSVVDQSIWERQAQVTTTTTTTTSSSLAPPPLTVEANLHALTRYFVGDIASTVLYGRNFMENNPNIMPDLWELDSRFNLFIAGVPAWLPGMRGPALARDRVVAAVQEHHDALYKYLDGHDPGYRWDDMSDVSSVIVDRAKAFRAAGASPRAYATSDAVVLWAMNVNANQIVFWLLWYVYSARNLLQEIRAEIAPHVTIKKPPPTGLPVKEAPRLEIDVEALWTKCPLLKGAFLETMRLESHSMSFKQVMRDFVVTESSEDARLLGKHDPQGYILRKGEVVCIPHGVHQSDERYFRDPDRFDPRRFWSKDPNADQQIDEANDGPQQHQRQIEKAQHQHIRVDYGTMKVWGGGKHICKGKTFAEREVVLFAAAILMQWDIAPAGDGGKWVHPGRKPGAGTASPRHDVRVRLTRRDEW